ncbi:MAG: hypothetical protein IPL78_01195 [Chloroflexi bacterium]|nr:hypothetical protein [Chloroflexota bacterium]
MTAEVYCCTKARLQADIRVITLPEGDDPDSFIRRQPQAWPELIEKADPVVAYVIRVITKNTNLNDAKEKAAAANRILPLIQEIPNPVERDHYRQLLARALKVDERSLQQLVATGAGRPVVEAKPRRQGSTGTTNGCGRAFNPSDQPRSPPGSQLSIPMPPASPCYQSGKPKTDRCGPTHRHRRRFQPHGRPPNCVLPLASGTDDACCFHR